MKFLPSLKDKIGKNVTKTAPAICSMLKHRIRVSFHCLLPTGWLQNYLNTIQMPNTIGNGYAIYTL